MGLNRLGHVNRDAGNGTYLFGRCAAQIFKRAKMRQQRLAPFGTNTRDAIQNRGNANTRSPLAMSLVGKAMRLIAHSLHKITALRALGKSDRFIFPGDKKLLFLFCQCGKRHLSNQIERLSYLQRG